MENKIKVRQTLVLTLEEMYNVIPNTRKLEGYNFKDLTELLVKLIEKIEDKGEWEFVQHVQNKPSLYIIREIYPRIFNIDVKTNYEPPTPVVDIKPASTTEIGNIISTKLPWEK